MCSSLLSSQCSDAELLSSPDTVMNASTISVYSLLLLLNSIQGTNSMFDASAVNINTKDNITSKQVKASCEVLKKFLKLWENWIDRIIEPEDNWFAISLKPGAAIESKDHYWVSKRDEAVIDEVFNAAKKDSHLLSFKGTNPAGWPVFVIWSKERDRPVINLCDLNMKVVSNAYYLLHQDDVIFKILRKLWIALFDLQKAYY